MEYIAHGVTLAEYMRSTSRQDETYTLVADTVRHMTHFAVPKNAGPRPVEGGSLTEAGKKNLKGLQRTAHLLKVRHADAREPEGREVRSSSFCRRTLSLIIRCTGGL